MLRWSQGIIERRIESTGESAELLLRLRDICGLAGRLSDSEPEESSREWIRSFLSPQDLGVLEGWETEVRGLVHSSEDPTPATSWRHLQALTALRQFLESYLA